MARPSRSRRGRSPALWAVILSVAAGTLPAVPAAGAAPAKGSASYSKREVTRAFKSEGLTLYDTGYNQPLPVTNLALVKPHDGWQVGVYIYQDQKGAKSSFNANIKAWLASGMAAARVKNVVVAVVPKGRSLDKTARRWPMPKLVAGAIDHLTNT